MRTTVSLDDDVARAVEQLRREHALSTSGAVNALARRGLAHQERERDVFVQTISALGPARVPVDDIAAALEVLEGEAHRG